MLSPEEKEGRKAFQVVYHRCSECERAWMQNSEGAEGIPLAKVKGREQEAEVVLLEVVVVDLR